VVQIFKMLTEDKKEYIMSKQLLRSGTNPGAMISEAQQAESGKDFVHKLSIGLKEIKETEYWLVLLRRSKYIDEETFSEVNNTLVQVRRMLISSIKTKKSKMERGRS
ncbi:MAG: four helix bundle protein, partial [Bacteroidota bacterium]